MATWCQPQEAANVEGGLCLEELPKGVALVGTEKWPGRGGFDHMRCSLLHLLPCAWYSWRGARGRAELVLLLGFLSRGELHCVQGTFQITRPRGVGQASRERAMFPPVGVCHARGTCFPTSLKLQLLFGLGPPHSFQVH